MIAMQRVVAVGIVVICAVGLAVADTLVTKDGRTFEGRVIRQDARGVEFEVHRGSARVTMTFDASNVSSITKGEITPASVPVPASKPAPIGDVPPEPEAPPIVAYEGSTYYVIPLKGEVGRMMTAAVLEKSLADAAKRKPSAVILEVDSPGGLISEVDGLTGAIRKHYKDLRLVVYVKRALSAAAITSLSAKEIYMSPEGLIGAATAYRIGANGLPEEIGEKFESVWRAAARSSAEIGGHNSLLAEAMIDSKIQLHVVEEGGRKVVREGRGDKMVTRAGRPLTLTANEAVDCGLARAKVDSYDQLAKAMGYAKWAECAGLGVPLAEHWAKVMAKVEGDMKKLREEFEDNMRQAAANDPTQYNYRIWSDTKRFTPDSQAKWEQRSAACTRFLTKAEQVLVQAAALAEKYPQLMEDPEMITYARKRIADIRTRIAQGIYKTNPDE